MKNTRQGGKGEAKWVHGDAKDLFCLSDFEARLIDRKISLAKRIRVRRKRANLTQGQLARAIGSTQPRIALLEKAHPSISLEFAYKALFALNNALGKRRGKVVS
ncbi:MAG: helix-turn-helix transcriptional regulator [Gemmataceae bacterium]